MKKYVKRGNLLRYYHSSRYLYYCPIFNYSETDVWKCLANGCALGNRVYFRLARIYGIGDKTEVNIDSSNGLRTGCWVCTVVRKDKSAEDLVKRGYVQLGPYLGFRNWLSRFRDNPRYRRKKRRNGSEGPGPITIKGRRIILSKVLRLQNEVKSKLISVSDLGVICREWERDTHS